MKIPGSELASPGSKPPSPRRGRTMVNCQGSKPRNRSSPVPPREGNETISKPGLTEDCGIGCDGTCLRRSARSLQKAWGPSLATKRQRNFYIFPPPVWTVMIRKAQDGERAPGISSKSSPNVPGGLWVKLRGAMEPVARWALVLTLARFYD
jgi:hypothetical protein